MEARFMYKISSTHLIMIVVAKPTSSLLFASVPTYLLLTTLLPSFLCSLSNVLTCFCVVNVS